MNLPIDEREVLAFNPFLKQIHRLAFENGQMRHLLSEVITTMDHAQTFIRTREKMHPTGIDLYCDLIARINETLNAEWHP